MILKPESFEAILQSEYFKITFTYKFGGIGSNY